MKKIALFLATVCASVSLAAVSVQAAPLSQDKMDPGCSVDVMKLLINQANAVRSRNRAYAREILNRQESTLYLTCFDQAMVLSAKLGFMFSDNVIGNPPPANTVVFTEALAYPDWGATHQLAVDIDKVVSPFLDDFLQNNFLPPWSNANNRISALADNIKTWLDEIKQFQDDEKNGPPPNLVAQYLKRVKDIEDLVNSFPNMAWDELPDGLQQYNDLIDGLEQLIQDIRDQRQNGNSEHPLGVGELLDRIKNAIMNTQMNCTRLDDIWNKRNAASQFYPPEGQDYYPLTPYFTMEELLNWSNTATPFTWNATLTLPCPPTGPATDEWCAEFATTTQDRNVLQQALDDLMGPLSKPGQSPIWPDPPIIWPGATEEDIINLM